MTSYEDARRSSLSTSAGSRGSSLAEPIFSGHTQIQAPSASRRLEPWINAGSHTQDWSSVNAQDDSESDPSSSQEFSPDFSDTDSSSGEATITAGPSGKGNLIGRALLAAGRGKGGSGGSYAEGNAAISESEDEIREPRRSSVGGGEQESLNRIPSSSNTSSVKLSTGNSSGWANQVYQERRTSGHSTLNGGPGQIPRKDDWPSQEKQGYNAPGLNANESPASESFHHEDGSTPRYSSSHSAATQAIADHYRYPNTASAYVVIPVSHSPVQRTIHPPQNGASVLSRSKPSSTATVTATAQTGGNQDTRSRSNEAAVSRTTSLPRMSRLHGFSPITAMRTMPNIKDGQHSPALSNSDRHNVDEDTSDQEGIYMDLSQSRRKRSLRKRRKAASDGSRTPVSPARTLSSSPVSPALSSLSSSLDSSPISNILGHLSNKNQSRPGDYPHDYAARTELRKRRGSQQNSMQQVRQASHPAYAHHLPPRLIHQPRSDFSAASTSGGSADVSSGYTASVGSGDTRSDAGQSSPGALGLSLGGASSTDGSGRRHPGLAQDPAHRRLLSDEGAWDSNYTDTVQSPSPILSAFETDVPAVTLPPSATGVTQSSRFPLLIFLLRLLAVVPATIGASSLMWNAVFPASATEGLVGHSAGDKLMCLPWAALTGMFCFELTTGLTRRWLLYYSLAPTLLRLVSLQSICWPSTFITLRYLGNIDILFAWIVVGTTTACSRSVQIWVTSNVPEISARTLKPAAFALATGSKAEAGSRNTKDMLDSRNRENFEKNRKKGRQAVNVWMRERHWDWDDIIGAVWIRVGILYIVTTAYLIGQRHL